MKISKIFGLAAVLSLASVPVFEETPVGEIGYSKGSLGYDALMAGKNDAALAQLEAAKGVDADDPARLINLGQAYARVGRTGDAARMFIAAMENKRSFDLLLANGEVMNSRDAAESALNNLNDRIASR